MRIIFIKIAFRVRCMYSSTVVSVFCMAMTFVAALTVYYL
jgi:hypothetical protein